MRSYPRVHTLAESKGAWIMLIHAPRDSNPERLVRNIRMRTFNLDSLRGVEACPDRDYGRNCRRDRVTIYPSESYRSVI